MNNQHLSPIELMRAHIHMGIGIIDHVEEIDDIVVVTSSRITDYYWNFAYSKSGSFTEHQIKTAKTALQKSSRAPALWMVDSDPLPNGWTVQSREAWMLLNKNKFNKEQTSSSNRNLLKVLTYNIPNADMVSVFKDAYSSNHTSGDIGYFELPQTYVTLYQHLQAQPPINMCHFGGYKEDACVAIASAVTWGKFGGIYSVATAHAHRRQGFGSNISKAAVEWLQQHKAEHIILQTEADSPVEKMYAQLGFQRMFIGCIYTEQDGEKKYLR